MIEAVFQATKLTNDAPDDNAYNNDEVVLCGDCHFCTNKNGCQAHPLHEGHIHTLVDALAKAHPNQGAQKHPQHVYCYTNHVDSPLFCILTIFCR